MVYLSLGQRLFNHQIMPTHRLTAKSVSFDGKPKTEYYLGSWLGSHITRRVHHGAVALAHVPAALVDLAGAAICSLGSVFVTSANAATFNKIDGLKDLNGSIVAQTTSFWMGVGHAIPGIFNHAVSVLNANAKSNPHRIFDDKSPASFGGYIGELPAFYSRNFIIIIFPDTQNPPIVKRVIALVSLIIVPIAKLLDLAPGLLFTLAAIITLGMWEKANTQAYRHLYSVSTIPQDVYFFGMLLINPTNTTVEGFFLPLHRQSKRSKKILYPNIDK